MITASMDREIFWQVHESQYEYTIGQWWHEKKLKTFNFHGLLKNTI